MIAITAELLHEVVRANTTDRFSGSTEQHQAEWPPSPARLFAALVAGGGTGAANRIGTDDAELLALEAADPPSIHANSGSDVKTTALVGRYVVIDEAAKGTSVQNYPVRKAQLERPGCRTAPRDPTITYVWTDLDLSGDHLDALRARAARVGYLGCADSPVRLSVRSALGDDEMGAFWRPGADVGMALPVPHAGLLGVLDEVFDAFTAGRPPRSMQIPRHKVNYASPTQSLGSAEVHPHTFWLNFSERIPSRRAMPVGVALRDATLSSYQRLFGEPPPALLGHGVEPGRQHARFIPLPNLGHRHGYGKGEILGACVWLPADTDRRVVAQVGIAIGRLSELRLRGGRITTDVAVRDSGGSGRWTTNPARWTTPADEFESAFPCVFERFGDDKNPLASVTRWCEHAGAPAPVAARLSAAPFFAKQPTFTSRDVWRPRSTKGSPFAHLWVKFAEPVKGPLVLGKGRTFGLGLLVPRSSEPETTGASDPARESKGRGLSQ